jgi:preprotein translocase subunit SecF
MDNLFLIGVSVVGVVIGLAFYLKMKQRNQAKDGVVLEFKQKVQETQVADLKKELNEITEQQKQVTNPENVVDFWNKKK